MPSAQGDRRNSSAAPKMATAHRKEPKKIVLCFDGTGNKFTGTQADSNILKIYRMLPRSSENFMSYYQPGIGTYVASSSLSKNSRIAKFKSAYAKAKDQAVGISFGDHVMGGYKFLMRYYNPGDEIFLLGFSRGAYTARFLAEMIDHVGILSAGNEEMARFAWKTFQKWQMRIGHENKGKKDMLEFMLRFRETFSRPIYPRIRFVGLFDTVNSVPTFENAWMKRSKFPYTARSTARVVRHAVAIDERRAKFRQDLITKRKDAPELDHKYMLPHHLHHKHHDRHPMINSEKVAEDRPVAEPFHMAGPHQDDASLAVPDISRDHSEMSRNRSLSPSRSIGGASATSYSANSFTAIQRDDANGSDAEQDIKEVWFAGGHGVISAFRMTLLRLRVQDLGGGWSINHKKETYPASHIPLVWMVREARRAGLPFDEAEVAAMNCADSEDTYAGQEPIEKPEVPTINVQRATSGGISNHRVNTSAVSNEASPQASHDGAKKGGNQEGGFMSHFHSTLHNLSKEGLLHDSLQFKSGLGRGQVITWNIMEFLPFRRLDLQPDGSWRCISWPLPMGEVRDIPDDALIHGSVIRRLQADEKYRPGNLICGGGGRGVKHAPTDYGIGQWKVHEGEGDPVGEVYVRAHKAMSGISSDGK